MQLCLTQRAVFCLDGWGDACGGCGRCGNATQTRRVNRVKVKPDTILLSRSTLPLRKHPPHVMVSCYRWMG